MWNYNFFIYIVTNRDKSILYVGVTNDLSRRLYEHYENRGNPSTFAGKYHCYYLIHYERFVHIEEAISREKKIKKWRREKKWDLIKSLNPEIKFLNKEINPE
ncbi:GIY-YIG nuclease family protein [Mucilaginibacter galii]|uniref:Endonuclease n=1 Tax=Mucilaginibacter galii TaxID=2005073 RepID=A0A917N1B1_9SPHI|nr:GIY-YIG nuclease family protein [Mucilaginibacter galii]GGI50359.1 endonuclease [Mucilaginibacter galii]